MEEVRFQINECIVKQTTKFLSLDDDILKKLKNLVKQSDENLRYCFERIFIQLQANNSHVRYVALLMCNEFMQRSHLFKKLMEEQFKEFITFTIIGDKPRKYSSNSKASSSKVLVNTFERKRKSSSSNIEVAMLPGPEASADLLRKTSLAFVEQWNDTYGKLYKKINLGYQYIKDALQFDFPNIRQQNELREQREKEKAAAVQKVLKVKYTKVKREMQEQIPTLSLLINQMEVLFVSIVPDLSNLLPMNESQDEEQNQKKEDEQFFISNTSSSLISNQDPSNHSEHLEENDEEDEFETDWKREEPSAETNESNYSNNLEMLFDEWQSGLHSHEIIVELNNKSFEGIKTVDNSELFSCLEENFLELKTKYAPMIQEWTYVLSTIDLENDEKVKSQQLLKQAIQWKEKIKQTIEKCIELGVASAPLQDTKKPITKQTIHEEINSLIQRILKKRKIGEPISSTKRRRTV